MKFILPLLLFIPVVATAQFRLAPVFSDNMVLQRDKPIHFWGKGIPGETVQVSFERKTGKTKVKADSTWSVYLAGHNASALPGTFHFQSGTKRIELNNVLIGDIWVCSGQSNMEWELQKEIHWKEEVMQVNQPLIRFINPPPVGRYVYGVAYTDSLLRRLTPDSFYLWNGWKTCDSSNARSFSAVAYYFAKSIVQQKGIPIGLVHLAIGGAPAETFISLEALQQSADFSEKVKPGNWLDNESILGWIRSRARQNVGASVNAYKDERGPNHAYKPGFAFSGGVEPLLIFPVTGMIWYQGESNSLERPRVVEYRKLMQLMINDYRRRWKNPGMPFYWVQLSSIDTIGYQSRYWPEFRNEQRLLLSELQNGGMAVCSDIGSLNDVHPRNKKTVGERLARWALNGWYEKKIIPSGPLPLKAVYAGNMLTVTFQYAANGLKAADGKTLRGFSLDGKNEADAFITGKSVTINTFSKPEYLYYGWKPFSDANLVNSEELPASTFKIKVE